MKKIEEKEKFEFLLSISDNIICQRYFTVRNHNPKSTKSLDLYETVFDIKEVISKQLLLKTIDIVDEFFKEDVSKLQVDPENFTITIKKGNQVIMERIFSADLYPPRVRYSVDIRPQISYILRELTDVLSLRNPYLYYLDKQL
jgi:hypothetical protein|tara:strand:+ start:2902 stop:3330 length:429 start_codon:yes stop_codon:yes gene_type:complete